MRSITRKSLLSIIGVTLFKASANAADAVVAAAPKSAEINTTLYTLVGLMIILLFIIGMLAYTLQQLGVVVNDKNRKERAGSSGSAGAALILLLAGLLPFSAYAGDDTKAPKLPEMIDGIPFAEFWTLVVVIGLEMLVIFFLAINIRVLLKVLKGEPDEVQKAEAKKRSWFWDKFNAAARVENEKEILLDHNYDGIQELDNSLPPWWKYGFYLTIVVGIIYIYRFHVSHDGMSQQEEYAAEMQKGEEDKAAYLAQSANNVDESNVKLLTDPASISAGKEVFVKNCAACHVADGGGNVGPNLTDEYWLHGGGIKDVFKSVKYGWQDKGMKSWKDDLSPIQIQQVACFIKSLKGTHPAAPKAPQGDLYIEVVNVDTAKVAAK